MTKIQFIQADAMPRLPIGKLQTMLLAVFFLSACSNRIHTSYLQDAPMGQNLKLSSACGDFNNYAPDLANPSHTPMRYVRVNFHIMRDSAGTINFDESTGVEFVKGLLADANQRLRDNRKMSLPEGNNTPALPMRYQYVLTPNPAVPDDDGIYFHYDNTFAFFDKKSPKKNALAQGAFEKYKTLDGSALNIFMFEHHPDSIKSSTYKSSTDGAGLSNWLRVIGLHQHAFDTVRQADGTLLINGPYYTTNLLQHEIGHTLGLAHTWNANDGCDDTPQNPGCWDHNSTPCKETGIYSNNMMDYNNCQCALTPCQLAKIHYNFSKEKASQRKLLEPVWCSYKPEATITINWAQKIIWNSSKDLEGDLLIANGAELTIQCEVSLPKGAKIIVKPKGKLILDGAKITNKCGEQWEGIEIWSSQKNKGEVVYLGTPVFENTKNTPYFQEKE
ncbi:MAG: M43 family zinc metalloprotease [Chitinophagales bacterium]|nr:M43 family zinc metalloprotease [Chitinophagales bacterium]